ncbi:TIGR03761 family integrating conjugative element protein, partial [Klebsiella variicola]|nr:TIGR03761 family integrating conjugative element protein [Klebsiella variicola]
MRRSKFAPPIVRRGLQQRGEGPAAAVGASLANGDEAAAADLSEGAPAVGEDESA